MLLVDDELYIFLFSQMSLNVSDLDFSTSHFFPIWTPLRDHESWNILVYCSIMTMMWCMTEYSVQLKVARLLVCVCFDHFGLLSVWDLGRREGFPLKFKLHLKVVYDVYQESDVL